MVAPGDPVDQVAPSRAHAAIRVPTPVWSARGGHLGEAQSASAQAPTVRVRRVVQMAIDEPPAALVTRDQPLVVDDRHGRANEQVVTPVSHPGASRNR